MKSDEDYGVLLAVVDHGSLTAAAEALDRSLQSVSRALAAIERQLKITLFTRTTRRVHPTPACLAFVERVRPALREIAAARDELTEQQAQLRGAIRVAAPPAFGARYIAPALAAFLRAHPGVSVELALSERHVDLGEAGADLALRLGHLPSSTLRAKRIGELRRVVFGAPEYFAGRGYPRVPADLADHDCLIRQGLEHDRWEFSEPGMAVDVRGRFRSTSAEACNMAAVAGCGVARAPLWQVRELVESGSVQIVLAEFEPQAAPLNLVWATGRALPRRVRALVDFLAERLSKEVG
ncbi:LysR family transcriptional regulator [Trinickia fusca]|uniref:LysR family transcriptional regulator n=1 Tax=Trinickia fusca TaxID=2419777 RepID=A0A494X5R0_9BURK|nr:LysR family transcriptional regulator [Trinickia fusca]RKP43514.1 LysR family transcriptional regulator [Trinickia fusca]